MMNFPNSPAVNDTVTTGGKTWKWDGTAWVPQVAVGPVGPTGATGPVGPAGPGDVSGPGSAVTADALAQWSGTTGTAIKQVTLSGLVKLTSGVPSAAVAGTDYVIPSGSITGSAATLTTARTINGTSFNGSANITTANWGTARNITVFGIAVSVNGSTTYTFQGRAAPTAAYTPSSTVAFSATPTFDCTASNVFEFGALTANVTSMTVSNAVAGQTINIRFVQDATGGRTVAVPSGAKVSGSINTAASSATWLVMIYSTAGARWEGAWSQVPA